MLYGQARPPLASVVDGCQTRGYRVVLLNNLEADRTGRFSLTLFERTASYLWVESFSLA
jgi:hypothetical protein